MATPLLLGYTVRAHLSRIDLRLVSASCIPKMSTRGISTSNVIEILLPNTHSNLYFITGNRFVADRLDLDNMLN